MKSITYAGVSTILLFSVAGLQAQAGAFQLNERSAAALGASLSGSVSAASEVTFATFNPAALTTVETFEIGGNISLVSPISNGTVQDGPFAGQGLDADLLGVVPSFAVGYRVTKDLVLGFSTYAPFGLATAYPKFSAVQADGRDSRLTTISFSPSVSYDVLDNLTFGASFDVLYVDARLTSAAVDLDGDDIGYAFSAGLLFEPVEGTQIGAAYHHGYDLNIKTNAFGGLPGLAEASLPNWAHIGVTQSVTDNLRVMAEGRWINWSKFDSIDITTPALAPGPFGSVNDAQNYKDAFFFAVGAEYDVNERFTVRSGVAWDETPTSDRFRTVRVPDEDRIWLSAGASYNMTDSMSIDFAYSYLRALRDPEVTLRNGPLAGTQVKYDGGAHIFSIGGSLKF
jgi:long-chain fatty acid transport protein